VSDGFERLSKTLGRRSLLKAAGVGALLAIVKPFRSEAATCPPAWINCNGNCCEPGSSCSQQGSSCCCGSGTTPCGTTCCKSGVACLNRTTSLCGCPSGQGTCYNRQNNTVTCCPPGKACGDPSCTAPGGSTTSGCCEHYADVCTSNDQCCTGRCSPQKGNRCGCRQNYDCPPGLTCDTTDGVCFSAT